MKLLVRIIKELSIFLLTVALSFLISFGLFSLIFENPIIQILLASILFIASIFFIAGKGIYNRNHSKQSSSIEEVVTYGAMSGFGGATVYFLHILNQLATS